MDCTLVFRYPFVCEINITSNIFSMMLSSLWFLQAKRELNDPENAVIGAFAGNE